MAKTFRFLARNKQVPSLSLTIIIGKRWTVKRARSKEQGVS